MKPYKVLSTKKLDAGLTEQALQKNIVLHELDFISVQSIVTEEKRKEIQDLLQEKTGYAALTSANAATALKELILPAETLAWQIFCLSGKTRMAVEGMAGITAMADDAASLAHRIVAHGVKELLFFCGNLRKDTLPRILNEAGIAVREAVVYETKATPQQVSPDLDGVLFFSPSAVESFFSVNRIGAQTACFAIGRSTAESISAVVPNPVIVSRQPDQETMLQSVYLYFNL